MTSNVVPPAAHKSGWWQFSRLYDVIINGLGLLAGLLLAVIPIVIIYDAALRIFQIGASMWAIDFTAIALVYITFFGSPWLLRNRGHVYVGILVDFISPEIRNWFGKFVCVVCVCLCMFLTVKSIDVTIANIGRYDVSATETPRWIRFFPLSIGFFFLSTEFLRLLFSRVDQLHDKNGSADQ